MLISTVDIKRVSSVPKINYFNFIPALLFPLNRLCLFKLTLCNNENYGELLQSKYQILYFKSSSAFYTRE